MIAILFLGVIGLILSSSAAWGYYLERRARNWPLIQARVVETKPRSALERYQGSSLFNLDSDHFLEWSVEGRSFRWRLEDESVVAVYGVKLWRKPPSRGPRMVRYDPRKPQRHFQESTRGAWRDVGIVGAITMALALIGLAFQTLG